MTQAEDYLLRELGERKQSLSRTRKQLRTMRYRLAVARAQRDRARVELRATKLRLDAARRQRDRWRTECDVLHAQLKTTEGDT